MDNVQGQNKITIHLR